MADQGRVVLLTGAAGGIGRVMTQALLADGHRIAAVDRDAASLDRLVALCRAGDRLLPVAADLNREDDCRSAVEAARERFGTVEAVINNAGGALGREPAAGRGRAAGEPRHRLAGACRRRGAACGVVYRPVENSHGRRCGGSSKSAAGGKYFNWSTARGKRPSRRHPADRRNPAQPGQHP
jgi:hypothetical protein